MLPAWSAHLVGVVGQLHAARLAAAAHLHLGLDDDRVAAASAAATASSTVSATPPGRDRDAEAGEVLLALVLVEIHLGAVSFVGVRWSCVRRVRFRVGGSGGHGARRAARSGQASRASSRASRASASHEPMESSGAPGVKTWATPSSLSTGMSASGMIPPDDDQHVAPARVGQQLDHLGHQGEVGPREQRQADGVGVLLHDGLDHLLGRLVQPGVDDLEAASRRARAMTLAPRSWPSRPGLATTTL